MNKTLTLISNKQLLILLLLVFSITVSAQDAKAVKYIVERSNIQALNEFKAHIEKKTLSIEQLQQKAKALNIPFSGEFNGVKYQLTGFKEDTGEPLYYFTYNRGAAYGTSTIKVYPESNEFNLTGEGMRVYEWDGGGVLISHKELTNRVVQGDKNYSQKLSDHATHVAGTMIATGVDTRARGMAYKAQLHAYDWYNDLKEMASVVKDGALLSNHSYGYESGFVYTNISGNEGWHWVGDDSETEDKKFGKYDKLDKKWDALALNSPYYLMVLAAGNSRGDGPSPGGLHYVRKNGVWQTSYKQRQKNGGALGFDCISYGTLSKNTLVVGAAQKITGGYSRPSDVLMADFSSFGPTDDGRIKPDITGIGVGIYSPISYSNSSYATYGGTSMAAPNVTGSLLLLQEHYKNLNGNHMKAATLKALAIATANEAGNAPGPDYRSGWGLLNTYNAAQAISNNGKKSLIEERTLNSGVIDTLSVKALGSEPLKVTIAWADPIPTNLADPNTLNDRTPMLVNDLDVKVKHNGETFYPWTLNPDDPSAAAIPGDNKVDNVEQVFIATPNENATYHIEISHKNNLKKSIVSYSSSGNMIVSLQNTEGQPYSLIITGIINNGGVTDDVDLAKGTLGIYPNPSDGKVMLNAQNGTSSIKVRVYSITGNIVFSKEYSGSSTTELDLTGLNKGIYIIESTNNNTNEKRRGKVIIK